MHALLVTIHVTAAAFVLGVLFLQSMAVVMLRRLPSDAQRLGVRTLLGRIQRGVFWPILLLTLLTGLWDAMAEDTFSSGRWLHWKLLLVVLLIGTALLTSQGLRAERPSRFGALAVHIAVFVLALGIVYLAVLQPF